MRTVHLLPFCFLKGQSDLFSFHSKDFFFPAYVMPLQISSIIFDSTGDLYRNSSNSRKPEWKESKKNPKASQNLIFFSPKIFIKENTCV